MVVMILVSKSKLNRLQQQLQPLLKEELIVNIFYETDDGRLENRSTGEVIERDDLQEEEHILNILVVSA